MNIPLEEIEKLAEKNLKEKRHLRDLGQFLYWMYWWSEYF